MTSYTMSNCDRIMGDGKWRTESPCNPCSGGLSHNFMVARLFANSPISRIFATGEVATYRELDNRGYDTMQGLLEFSSGASLLWRVCLAVQGAVSPFAHRTVSHCFQFRSGSLNYSSDPMCR